MRADTIFLKINRIGYILRDKGVEKWDCLITLTKNAQFASER